TDYSRHSISGDHVFSARFSAGERPRAQGHLGWGEFLGIALEPRRARARPVEVGDRSNANSWLAVRDCGEVANVAAVRLAVLLPHSADLCRTAGNWHCTGTCVIPFTGDLWLRFSLRRAISRPRRAGPLRC